MKGGCEIWLMAADGSGLIRIARFSPSKLHGDCAPNLDWGSPGPVWSPDGRELAALVGNDLIVMDAGGSILRRIHVGGSAFGIAWQPIPESSSNRS